MHELALASGIVETARAAAGAARITVVRARIGALAGVAAEALQFSFAAAARGTIAEGARLVVEPAPLVLHCATCGHDTERMELQFGCASCGESACELRSGREVIVESVEVV